MYAHDASTRMYPAVKHVLHGSPLIQAIVKPDAVALPVTPRPAWFGGSRDLRITHYSQAIVFRNRAALRHHLWQALELFSPNRRLNIRHSIVEAN